MKVDYYEITDYLDIPMGLIEDWCAGRDFVVLKYGIVATIGGCVALYADNDIVYYPPDLWEAMKVRKILNDIN